MYEIILFENHPSTCFAWMDLNYVMHYKFTREKNDWHMLCQDVASNITRFPLGQLSWRHRLHFPPMNFAPNRYEPRNRKIRTLRKSSKSVLTVENVTCPHSLWLWLSSFDSTLSCKSPSIPSLMPSTEWPLKRENLTNALTAVLMPPAGAPMLITAKVQPDCK